MDVFVTSDHHFGHANIIKYCSRPFIDCDSMHAEMISRWNSVVSKDDIVLYLGDLTASLAGRVNMLQEIISSLNGKKLLVRGNHDHMPDEWYVDNGFLGVYKKLRLGDVMLSHYPEANPDYDQLKWFIHGHVHKVRPPAPQHSNVVVDHNNFTPVNVSMILPANLLPSFYNDIRATFDMTQLG